MTTLDPKALEAVKDAAQGWEGLSAEKIAELAIAAYDAALPPAKPAWLLRRQRTKDFVARIFWEKPKVKASFSNSTAFDAIEIEIREVRS